MCVCVRVGRYASGTNICVLTVVQAPCWCSVYINRVVVTDHSIYGACAFYFMIWVAVLFPFDRRGDQGPRGSQMWQAGLS